MDKPWAIEKQRERGALLLGLVREAARRFFEDDGRCVVNEVIEVDVHKKGGGATSKPFFQRERVNCVVALMAGTEADAAWGNRILERIEFTPCDFTTMNLIEILVRHPARVTPTNRERMLKHIAHEVKSVQKPYNAFVGANDNFPCMGTHIMIVGGELVHDADAVQAGIDNLYALRDLLSRRGFLSEYNSPTYSCVSLHGLEETANTARNVEARELAQLAAERVWLDVALHWHPQLGYSAGPFSRAYHNNSIAWSAMTSMMVWVAMGDGVVFFNAPPTLYADDPLSYEKRADIIEFCQAGLAGYAGTLHHFPDYIGEMFLKKRYPFRVRGTTEFGTFHYGDYKAKKNGAVVHVPGATADFGADWGVVTSYLERDFSLGTALRNFCGGGQTDLFFEMHKLKASPKSWGDVRSVFTRYVVNDASPEDKDCMGLLVQHGNGFGIQDDRRSLVLYHPTGYLHTGVRSLKLSLILQELTSPVEEIWIGDRRLADGNGEAAKTDWVILKDGRVYLAFYPLAQTDLGRQVAVRSVSVNGYRVISFYNYEGPARDFAMHDLQVVQNGFVCEVAPVADYPDAPAFLAALRSAQIADSTVLESRRVRYLRDGRELFFWVDPAPQSIKAAVVNGQVLSTEPLKADGIKASRVPWLGGLGIAHDNLDWWQRISDRPTIDGLEALSGRCIEREN